MAQDYSQKQIGQLVGLNLELVTAMNTLAKAIVALTSSPILGREKQNELAAIVEKYAEDHQAIVKRVQGLIDAMSEANNG